MIEPGRTGDRTCVAAGDCHNFDHAAKRGAYVGAFPLCPDCLRVAERDISGLPSDYVGLEQQLAKPLSVWSDGQPRGSGEAPIPLRTDVEGLQREMVHVATTWAGELRARARLSEPPARGVRDGWALQAAVTILAPRLHLLARIEPTVVFPAGPEGDPQDVAGWEAVLALADLHHRARGLILGRGRRRFWVPGECWEARCATLHRTKVAAGDHASDEWLWRSEPARYRDEPPVWCRYCAAYRTYDEYQRYVQMLVWPARRAEVGAVA